MIEWQALAEFLIMPSLSMRNKKKSAKSITIIVYSQWSFKRFSSNIIIKEQTINTCTLDSI